MNLNQIKEEYDRAFDRVLDQMEIVSATTSLSEKSYMSERAGNAILKELNEQMAVLKKMNYECRLLDQMMNDRYTVREMYIVDGFKLNQSNTPYDKQP